MKPWLELMAELLRGAKPEEEDEAPLTMRPGALKAAGYGADISCPKVGVQSGNDVDED